MPIQREALQAQVVEDLLHSLRLLMYVVTKSVRFIAVAEAREVDKYFAPPVERGVAGDAG